jgi:hypothetical protein
MTENASLIGVIIFATASIWLLELNFSIFH